MASQRAAIAAGISELLEEGTALFEGHFHSAQIDRGEFIRRYLDWYSKSLPVVRALAADRLAEFETYYMKPNRKEVDFVSYTLSDYCRLVSVMRMGQPVFDVAVAAAMVMNSQVAIVRGLKFRIEDRLADIVTTLQAEVFDDELAVAGDLAKRGHLRAAGAVAGVVLERHLRAVADAHAVVLRKKAPSVADLNDPLKESGAYDTPTWRRIQHLADIRNLCVHARDREPTTDELNQMLSGVGAIVKNVF